MPVRNRRGGRVHRPGVPPPRIQNTTSKTEDLGPIERPGKVLQHQGQTYVLIHELGVGAYASVWMCYSVGKKELFAIKIFKAKEVKVAKKEIALFEKFRKLNVHNTIKLHTTFEHNGQQCLVIDLMAGSLYDLIKKGGTEDGTTFRTGFEVDFVINVVHQVLTTLADLHDNGIIHGDIKPENILLYGRAKVHSTVINTLQPKTSVKKITDAIKEMEIFKALNKKNNEDEDDSNEEGDTDDEDEGDEESGTDESGTDSEMSKPPRKITLSEDSDEDGLFSEESGNDLNHDQEVGDLDVDEDSSSVADVESEEEETIDYKTQIDSLGKGGSKLMDHLKLPKSFMSPPCIKLSDMGSCVSVSDAKKPIGVQTKYYKSPEIILGLNYSFPCDVWALGCTVYELLTGEVLFNPDEYNVDKKRCILHQVCGCIGKIPREMINDSPYRQVFFTDGYTLKENEVYGDDFYQENRWGSLLENISCGTIKKYLLLDLLLDMLKIDPIKRITARDALKHPVFKLI